MSAVESKDNIVDELVEHIVDGMDMNTLVAFVKDNLIEYYMSDAGAEDFEINYQEMKHLMGDE
tara:strand:- start:303 stop:491 length:189 start_codon:yes stop_codon:yes gene_type:complete